MERLRHITTTAVIHRMKAVFARHGIPKKVISDNGPCYSSHEFKQFADSWGFQHVTSSPHYPQSNGLAEKTVQTAKRIFTKAKEDKRDPYLSLLEYRNTPVDGLKSPAQILMSRRLRSILPNTTTTTSGNPPGHCMSTERDLPTAPKRALQQICKTPITTTHWSTHPFPARRWHMETSNSHPTS